MVEHGVHSTIRSLRRSRPTTGYRIRLGNAFFLLSRVFADHEVEYMRRHCLMFEYDQRCTGGNESIKVHAHDANFQQVHPGGGNTWQTWRAKNSTKRACRARALHPDNAKQFLQPIISQLAEGRDQSWSELSALIWLNARTMERPE